MTKSKIFVVIGLLASMAGSVYALDLAKWKYQAEIAVEKGEADYCRLVLTPEVYNAARLDLGDIRLIGADGKQIPYVLDKQKDITEKLKYKPAVINRSTSEDGMALVTLDFGKKEVKNSIEVETGGNNFRRAVKIEGSNNNVEFFTLVEQAYVFAISQNKRFSKIDLPANDYRYLRITVWPMATEEKSPAIKEVKTFKIRRKSAKHQPMDMTCVEHREDEKNNASIYVYDLSYRHLPISEIKLDIAADSFYRYVTIEGRDAATRKVKLDSEDNRQRFREVEVKWKRIVSDTIYRYIKANGQRKEKLVLHIPAGGRVCRYLKITIKNYDDNPVTVKSASAKTTAHSIVFAVEDSATATLYVGSKLAPAPRYDLRYKLSKPAQIAGRTAKLGNITNNPLFGQAERKPVAWTEEHKILLWIIMGTVLVVLVGFILNSFKSFQSEQSKSRGS